MASGRTHNHIAGILTKLQDMPEATCFFVVNNPTMRLYALQMIRRQVEALDIWYYLHMNNSHVMLKNGGRLIVAVHNKRLFDRTRGIRPLYIEFDHYVWDYYIDGSSIPPPYLLDFADYAADKTLIQKSVQ